MRLNETLYLQHGILLPGERETKLYDARPVPDRTEGFELEFVRLTPEYVGFDAALYSLHTDRTKHPYAAVHLSRSHQVDGHPAITDVTLDVSPDLGSVVLLHLRAHKTRISDSEWMEEHHPVRFYNSLADAVIGAIAKEVLSSHGL